MAHFDGEIYCVIDTILSTLDRRYALIKFNGIEWEEYNDFGFSETPVIRNMKVHSIGDTMLLIVMNYHHSVDQSQFERTILLKTTGIEILTDHKTRYQMFSSWRNNKALVNGHGFVYFDKLNQDPNDSKMIIVFNDGVMKDTINQFDTIHTNPLRSASENGFDIHSQVDFGSFTSQCICNYDLSSEEFSPLVFSGVVHDESSNSPNGSVYTTIDSGWNPSSNPNRRVLRYVNNQSSMIGDPNMEKAFSILNTPMGLIVEAKMFNESIFRVYKYDGGIYTPLSGDTLWQSNGYSANVDFMFFQDHLYLYGHVERINQSTPAWDILRTPYTHLINLSPLVQDDNFSVPTDTSVVRIRMRENDWDPDGDHLFGSVISAQRGLVQQHISGDFVYTPQLGYQGFDTIYYKSCDAGGLCDSAFIYLNILNIASEFPVANRDTIYILENESFVFDVTLNDNYQGESVIFELLDSTINGSINSFDNGILDYSPNMSFAGTDSLRYAVQKSYGAADTTWVFIDVELINSPPITEDGNIFLTDEINTVFLSNFFEDIDGDMLTKEIIDGPFHPNAQAYFGTHHRLFYQNEFWQTVGFDSVQFEICDPYGECDTSYIVFFNNRLPVALRDTIYLSTPNQVIFPVINDYDLDDNLSSVAIRTHPAASGASAQVCGPFCIQYYNTDFSNFTSDSIEYELIDDFGMRTTAWITMVHSSLSVEEKSLQAIQVFPVPTTGELFFNAKSGQKVAITVFDAAGATVYSTRNHDLSESIDLSHLAKGAYWIQFDDSSKTQMFAIE